MSKILDLNAEAVPMLGENTQVRVRTKGEMIQIRPSARVLASNLPKGEALRLVSVKRVGGKVHAMVNVEDFADNVGQSYEVARGKYGWLNLSPVAEVAKGASAGSIKAA